MAQGTQRRSGDNMRVYGSRGCPGPLDRARGVANRSGSGNYTGGIYDISASTLTFRRILRLAGETWLVRLVRA